MPTRLGRRAYLLTYLLTVTEDSKRKMTLFLGESKNIQENPRFFPDPAAASSILSMLLFSGVKLKKIDKGRMLADLKDIWMVCVDILPLQKSNEKA